MRESCTSGSVRGARGNSRPYRDPLVCGYCAHAAALPSNPMKWRRHPLGIAFTAHGKDSSITDLRGSRQGLAALRNFNPAYSRIGSCMDGARGARGI